VNLVLVMWDKEYAMCFLKRLDKVTKESGTLTHVRLGSLAWRRTSGRLDPWHGDEANLKTHPMSNTLQ
jgi:hypothetical protein